MKKNLLTVLAFVIVFSCSAFGQYKDTEILKPGVKSFIVDDSDSFLFGLFDPSRFAMHHSYSMSYSAGGGNGVALGVYTNSMFFKLASNLNFQIDAQLSHSPYNTFGGTFGEDLSGFRISRAQLNYQPWKNFTVNLSYQQLPANAFGYGGGYGNGFYYGNPFFDSMWDNSLNQGR
ncbi:MAG: hypothetical protein IT279_05870 [Ignavibacteriaceae bacterium]|nr:hypothetical protein [Ignavibacteriaceae bacterium]